MRYLFYLLLFFSAKGFSQKKGGDSLWGIDTKSKVLLLSEDFSGSFGVVKGKMVFDPSLKRPKKLDLLLDVNSLDLEVPGMTKHALSSDYFHAAQFPVIRFQGQISTSPAGDYFAEGNMTVKGVVRWIKIPVKWEPSTSDKNSLLSASFPIKRTDFNVGDETSVSNEVKIDAKLYFKNKK